MHLSLIFPLYLTGGSSYLTRLIGFGKQQLVLVFPLTGDIASFWHGSKSALIFITNLQASLEMQSKPRSLFTPDLLHISHGFSSVTAVFTHSFTFHYFDGKGTGNKQQYFVRVAAGSPYLHTLIIAINSYVGISKFHTVLTAS